MTHSRRTIGYLLVAVLLVTASLLFAFQRQRAEAVQAADRTQSAVTALTAMLDQETGMRGYLYTGHEEFLQPYNSGQAAYAQARLDVAAAARGDTASSRLADSEDAVARNWQQVAAQAIDARRQTSSTQATSATIASRSRAAPSRSAIPRS